MKKLIIGLVILIGLSISAYAQMGMMGGQQGGKDGPRPTDAYDELSDDAADVRTGNDARRPADANDADDGSRDDAGYDADDDEHDGYAGKDDDGC